MYIYMCVYMERVGERERERSCLANDFLSLAPSLPNNPPSTLIYSKNVFNACYFPNLNPQHLYQPLHPPSILHSKTVKS